MMGETEWEVTKDGKKLGDFKYACIGYSSHRVHPNTPGSAAVSAPPLEGQAELPLCVGLEVSSIADFFYLLLISGDNCCLPAFWLSWF